MEERRFDGLDPSELETHRPWLRRLAVTILRDADQAEDCVQDVFLTALRGGPAPRPVQSSVRAWLKRVLVNRARKSIDREALRRHHEAVSERMRPQHLEPGDPLELRELQAELHSGVLALAPRYRDVVLLRHEQSLSASQIAERLAVPTKTVQSRLERAYDKLRQRLDGRLESYRDRVPLVLGTLEGARSPQSAPPMPNGQPGGRLAPLRGQRMPPELAPARLLRWLWAPAALIAAGSALYIHAYAGASRPPREALALPSASPAAARAEVEPPAPTAGVARTELPVPERAFVPVSDAVPALDAVEGWSGRVVDAEGRPVPGLRLRFEPLQPSDVLLFSDRASSGCEELFERIGRSFEPELADDAGALPLAAGVRRTVSAADGSFALPACERLGWLAVEERSWSTVTTAVALVLPPVAEALVRVAPARRVAGRVLDQEGRPLGSVRVVLRLPGRFLAAESGAPTTLAHEPSAFSGDDGGFVLERVPDVGDATLRFHANGYEPLERALGSAPEELLIELRAEPPEAVLAGRALDPSGAPIEGAFLSFDWSSTAISDERGEFRLHFSAAGAAGAAQRGTLRAAAQGFQPLERSLARTATAAPLSSPSSTGGAWPSVELVFDAPALEMNGLVLRADGTAHTNAAVWAPAPSLLGLPPGERPPIFAEHVMGGPQQGGSLEATVSDAQGLFRLLGLQERSYVLRVADLETREWFETPPIQAGRDDVLLEFPPDGCYPQVRGSVVDKHGAPVALARVARTYPRLDACLPDGRRYQTRFSGQPVEVGADGRFSLASVARRGGLLSVFGPDIQTRHVELERMPDPSALQIEVGRVSRVVVERGGLDCDRFSFQAPGGRGVEFQPAVQGVARTLTEAPLAGERSAEVLVSDLAQELVLWSGAREVARLPIDLLAGELNVLSP